MVPFVISLCLFIVISVLLALLVSELIGVLGLTMFSWSLLEIKVIVTPTQCLFIFMLVVVFITIIVYSVYYIGEENNYLYYSVTMSVFLLSMILLLVSSSLVLLLIGWDLLGITSFLLVHHNNNWESTNGALNTVLSNRVGDLFLFLSVLIWVPFVNLGLGIYGWESIFNYALLGAAITKSAQVPFSGWLPKAMAAPTPTSALVHSSTLVTAGLLVIIKFVVPIITSWAIGVILWVGLLTMAVAGVVAIVEEDVKKVVALSTLSQMGLSMSTIGVGYYWVGYLHLVSHGFFKSLLFLQVGYLIHLISNLQDPRIFMALGKSHLYLQVLIKTSLLTLCGQMFANGIVTKEVILNHYMGGTLSVFTVIVFMVSLILTFLYSYRLWLSLFKFGAVTTFVGQGSLLIKVVSFMLVIVSVSYMWWLSVNLVIIPAIFTHEGGLASVFLMSTAGALYVFIKSYKHSLLSSKFFGDSVLTNVRNAFMPVKFLELMHYSLNSKAFVGIKLVAMRLNLYIKGMNITTVFIIVMLVLLW